MNDRQRSDLEEEERNMSEEMKVIVMEKLEEEKAIRKKAEKVIETFRLIVNQNLPEELGKCFYILNPETAFETAYKNSPQSFSEFPECANPNLTFAEKYKMYKERKPFIRAICKYCRN